MRPTRKTRRPLVGALLAALALAIATVAGQSQVLAAAGSLGGLTSANLGVDQTDNPDPVLVGQELTYTAVASNAGPDAAPGARLVAKLPAQVDFLSADGPQGPCAHPAKRRVVCVLGELASNSTATVVIGVRPSKAGPIDNVVTVDSRADDPRPQNNTDTERTRVEAPEPVPCAGRDATIVGTDGPDTLTGTDKNDVIAAFGGNDTVVGLKGHDVVCGSGGDDVIRGKGGPDDLRAGGGNDQVTAGGGNDQVQSRSGDDAVTGGRGNDSLRGGGGNDVVRGKGGDDALRGGTGDDELRGGGGVNTCRGGGGSDTKHNC